jgi:hypothetical protein
MSEQATVIAAWVGLAVLFFLCLPINSCRKFVLSITSLVLREALLAALVGGAYLYFRPGDLPSAVTDALTASPMLLRILPDPSASYFGLCLACLVVAPLVPVLAALDVTRILAGRRLAYLRAIADGRPAVVSASTPPREPARAAIAHRDSRPAGEPVAVAVPVERPIDPRAENFMPTATPAHLPVAPVRR